MKSTRLSVCILVACTIAVAMWTAGASAQTPAPTLHWNAGDINGNGTGADNPADGASVTSWVDSAAGQDATEATDAPVFVQVDADFNSQPVVRFDGGQILTAPDDSIYDVPDKVGYTAFVVAAVGENGDSPPAVFYDHREGGGGGFRGQTLFLEARTPGATSDGSGVGMTLGAQVNTPASVIGYNTPADNFPGGNGSANPLVPDEFEDDVARIYSVVFDRDDTDGDGASVHFGIDSLATILGAKDDGTSPAPPLGVSEAGANFTIGHGPNFGGGTLRLHGRIAEILIFHSELSVADQTSVLNGLGAAYNIAIVPEPSTCVLVLLGALGMIAYRRR